MSADPWLLEPDGLPARDSQPYAHEKLHYAGHYMSIFANGMKNSWPNRAYMDLMAGPGRCLIDGLQYAGSPLRSIQAPFTHRLFVESNPELAAALVQRVGPAGTVITGDCNSPSTIDQIRAQVPARALSLAFVDNVGLTVALSTLERLTKNRSTDLMIVFQLQAITRNVRAVMDGKQERESWDAFFGTTLWSDVVSQLERQGVMPGPIAETLLLFYLEQLKQIGYLHATPGIQVMKNSNNGAQYRLILAGKHERAIDFFKKIEKINYAGQRQLW